MISSVIKCAVTLFDGTEFEVVLTIELLKEGSFVGKIISAEADDGYDPELANDLVGRILNTNNNEIFLKPHTATYKESANRGP